MRVHTKVVIDMTSGAVLEDQWYEYDGPVALAGGGDSPPPPSEEERELQRQQAELLELQRRQLEQQLATQELLAPFLYEALGLRPIYETPGLDQQALSALQSEREKLLQEINEGPWMERARAGLRLAQIDREIEALKSRAGERVLTGFEKIPPTEAEKLREEIELGLLERSKAALEGKLPVSPTLEREIEEQEKLLRETLLRNLGPGYETSTPGIEALQEHMSRATEAREAARRGELTLSEQLSLARGGQNFQMGQATRGELMMLPQMRPDFTRLIASYSDPLNRMFQERWNRYQVQASQPSFGSTLGQFLGIGAGAAIGGIGGAIGQQIGAKIGKDLFS